ncbi:MAG: hypothetical protein Q9163_005402 [Psora crenata]
MLAITARAARPKLSLAVPPQNSATATGPALSLKATTTVGESSLPSPAPRHLAPPTFASHPETPAARRAGAGAGGLVVQKKPAKEKKKKVQFRAETEVKCVTPLPEECYGAYVKMTREERTWTRRD